MKFTQTINIPNLLARILLALILATAACAKLSNPEGFQTTLESFKLFPKTTLSYLTSFIPVLELCTAILLTLKNKTPQGAILSILLSLSFVVSLMWGIITKSITDCGCFGDWELAKVSPEAALLRAILILALSTLLMVQVLANKSVNTLTNNNT